MISRLLNLLLLLVFYVIMVDNGQTCLSESIKMCGLASFIVRVQLEEINDVLGLLDLTETQQITQRQLRGHLDTIQL